MRIDPHRPNVQLISENGVVFDPWRALADGLVHVCRAVSSENDNVDHCMSESSFIVQAGETITYRPPIDTRALAAGTDPVPLTNDLAVRGHKRWSAPDNFVMRSIVFEAR